MSFTIYHNPKCSKSRQTLALLEEQNINPKVVLYLQQAPKPDELKKLLKQLGCKPQAMLRFKEDLAKQLGLSEEDERTDAQWLEILSRNIQLLERPIVSNGTKAVIGRPPENILQLI